MKTNSDEKQNFWIAYADLMAGLLFVFILLVGGIIVKYFLIQENLEKKNSDFLRTMAVLQSSEEKNKELENLNKIFTEKLEKLNLKIGELENKNKVYILQIDDLNSLVNDLKNDNLDLNKTLNSKNSELSENATKIAYLLELVSQKENDFNKILHDLNVTKNRIRNLTGIKVKVIAQLKEKLGNDISIDPVAGDLRLSSSVLFDKGSAELKEEAKESFKQTLQKYFDVLISDKNIKENLESIVIEGHTDSDGGYLYNLKLSQNRATAVMDFINTWSDDDELRKYLVASGRSYTMPIIKNGVEDKDASRRIEIKFNISNKEAINEIQNFLDYEKSSATE